MILAIDIGNTDIVFGLFKNNRLLLDYRFPGKPVLTVKEYYDHLSLFCQKGSVSSNYFEGVVITSVVPNVTNLIIMMAQQHLGLTPVIVSGGLDLGFRIFYDDPQAVGADRLCNVIAAFKKYGGPAIVIDLGTATTYDVISKEGDYLGGLIAPGIRTSATALHQSTAQLPTIELQFPDNVIGTNTISSMQAGILFGTIDSLEGIVHRIQQVIGKNAVVIGTGGFATLIAGHSKIFDHIESGLVLEGAYLIYKRLHEKTK